MPSYVRAGIRKCARIRALSNIPALRILCKQSLIEIKNKPKPDRSTSKKEDIPKNAKEIES